MQRTPTTLQSPLSAPTRSSGPHHERVADPWVYWCGWLLYRKLRSVISHHRLSLFCCAVHVVSCECAVCRASDARREKKKWIFGNTVKWSRYPILDLMARVRASQSSYPFFKILFSPFFLYYVRKPRHHRHHTSKTGCVLQPAGYNAILVCRLPAEPEATPHACGSLSALYYCCGFLFNS